MRLLVGHLSRKNKVGPGKHLFGHVVQRLAIRAEFKITKYLWIKSFIERQLYSELIKNLASTVHEVENVHCLKIDLGFFLGQMANRVAQEVEVFTICSQLCVLFTVSEMAKF